MHGLRTIIALNDGRLKLNFGATMDISANRRAEKLTANGSNAARETMTNETMLPDYDAPGVCEVCGGSKRVMGKFTKFRLNCCDDCGVDSITPIENGVLMTAKEKVLN